MQENIRIKNSAGVCSIDIEGTIGVPEAWQFDDPAQRVATYQTFCDTVRRIESLDAEHIVVNIRSTGGDVNDALLIYDALTSLPARITTRCYGYTASAATIIAQAASQGCREISANALYLIHNSMCATEGNADELAARIDLLQQTDRRLAALYAARAARGEEQFAALMAENNGTGRWLAPEEAIAEGLADAIIGATEGEQKKSITHNIVRGWKRLLRKSGKEEMPAATEDRNILHFGDDEQLAGAKSVVVVREAQEHVHPTATHPTEDPATHEILRSANDRAYTADARRFSKF